MGLRRNAKQSCRGSALKKLLRTSYRSSSRTRTWTSNFLRTICCPNTSMSTPLVRSHRTRLPARRAIETMRPEVTAFSNWNLQIVRFNAHRSDLKVSSTYIPCISITFPYRKSKPSKNQVPTSIWRCKSMPVLCRRTRQFQLEITIQLSLLACVKIPAKSPST